MSMPKKNHDTKPGYSALIIGETGLVGKYCLQNLLRDPQYSKITVLSQRELSLRHQKLTVHIIDFEKLHQFADLIEADHIFYVPWTALRTAGPRENFRRVVFSYPLQIAQISQKKGIKQFMMLSVLTASSQSRFFYNRVRGELEEAITKIPFQTVLVFRTLLILGKHQENRPAQKLVQMVSHLFNPLLCGKLRRFRSTHARVIATAMTEFAKIKLRGIHIFEPDQMQFFYNQLSKKGHP